MKNSFLPPSNKNNFQNVILLLVASVPISIGVLNPLAEITLTAALLLSIVFFALNWQATTNNLQSTNKTVLVLFAMYFGIGALTYFTHEHTEFTLHRIGTTLHFVLIIPIMVALGSHTQSKNWLHYPIIAGSILSGGFAIYQASKFGIRAGGSINEMIFGGISILLGFMSLASWRQFSKVNYGYLWPILGFLSGLTASILSMTRGSWIAAPALAICVIIYMYYNITNKRRLLLALSAGLILAALIMWWSWPYLQPRISISFENWNQYFNKGNTTNSTGFRLEMWKGALLVIQDNPLLGVGMGGKTQAFADLITDGKIQDIGRVVYVHNQILQDGIHKGLLGIASYFALMGYLIRHFIKGIKQKLESSDAHLIGLLLVVGYLIIGLTSHTFNNGIYNSFFVGMTALVFCFTERRQE
jgi:O-antigen ligase